VRTQRIHANVFGKGERAVFVHGSFGWGLDTFPEQSVLGGTHQVVIVDRRGYGGSPAVDDPGWHHDVRDVIDWLGDRAHLVGQSYGAVVCLLTAGLRPDAVRSLTVIEPVAASVARGDEGADKFAAAMRASYAAGKSMSAPEFLEFWYRAIGRTGPLDTSAYGAAEWSAVDTTRRERPVVDAPVDLATLRAAPWPTLIVKGGWPGSTGMDLLRDASASACRCLHAEICGQLVEFENSAHNPQIEEPARFNSLLQAFWASTSDDE
jgi:pimeloyl-ACP methyl ester carboxylesterase